MSDEQLSGRDLDLAVAERVMGWRLLDRQAMGWNPNGRDVWATGNLENPTYQRFMPSESIEAAMLVVEKMRERGWRVGLSCSEAAEWAQWLTEFIKVERADAGAYKNQLYLAEAKSLPEAICRAALSAMEEKKS